MPNSQLYEMTIKATGEVRDQDGNLVSATPMEATITLTEDEVRVFTEGREL